MQLIQGASIFSTDGKQVGRIDRVVIELKTRRITHLVIRTGLLIAQDKVASLDLVAVGEQDQLVLRLCTRDLAKLPDFGVMHYRATDEEGSPPDEEREPRLSPSIDWCPPFPLPSVGLFMRQPSVRGTRINLPPGTIAVKEGAKVVSVDGRHVGCMERVLTSPPREQATYFQVSKGWRLKERKLVPFEWVDRLDEDQLRLAVGARMISDLPE